MPISIILLNGPPGSGKDFGAEALMDALPAPVFHLKFSSILKTLACTMLGVTPGSDKHSKLEAEKNTTLLQPFAETFRQLQIDISEKFMKPCYGQDIFGQLMAKAIEDLPGHDRSTFIISDSGFWPEAEVLAERFGYGSILLFNVYRDGHNFYDDSRSYINNGLVLTRPIWNGGDHHYTDSLVHIAREWLRTRNG